MRLVRKIGAGCLSLFIVAVNITGRPPQAAFGGQQVMERQAGPQAEHLKTAYGDFGVIDSTGKYEYAIGPDGNAVILTYLKEEETVKIPAAFDGHPVTAIGRGAFYSYSEKRPVTSIQIPDTVTEIGERAFCGTGIKEITLPDSVLKIGQSAFENCRDLERVFISKSVEEISGNVFCESGELAEIEVDSRNTAFKSEDGILYNKDMTEILAVPEGKDMAGFQFPDSVEVIGRGAFAYCKNMRKVVLGKNVENIGPSAFLACKKLSEVILDDNLKVIGRYAFRECDSLVEINIPDGTREIGEWALCHCEKLTKITVPKSVTYIGTEAIGYNSWGEGEVCLGVFIIGYEGTAAYNYANKCGVAFRNAETGEETRYDLMNVPSLGILKIKAGKKQIRLEYDEEDEATYQIAIKKAGTSVWKKYNRAKASAVIKGLKSGKKYEVKVRARRKTGGKYYYGNWSFVRTVTVR